MVESGEPRPTRIFIRILPASTEGDTTCFIDIYSTIWHLHSRNSWWRNGWKVLCCCWANVSGCSAFRLSLIVWYILFRLSIMWWIVCIFQTQISQFAGRSRKTLTAEPRDWRAKWNVMSSPNRAPRASVGPSTAPASWWRLRQDIGRRPTGPSPSCATHLAANSISGLCSAGPQILWAPSRSHASTTFTQPVTIITIPFLFIPTTRFDYRNISI